MKAVIFEQYGDTDVLKVRELPIPIPRDDEIRIKIRAVEVTKSDCELRGFHFPVKWFWLPVRLMWGITKPRRQILGSYFAGEVDSLGKNVSGFEPGDKIYGCARLRMGAYGEYDCLPFTYTMLAMPAGISFAEAASVPFGGLNGLHFMRRGKVKPGDKVLIIGAGGSIGCYALQIAVSMGAEVTVVDLARKESLLRSLGASHFIDYTRQDFAAQNQRYDVVFSMVAGTPIKKLRQVLTPHGRLLFGNPRIKDFAATLWINLFSRQHASAVPANETKDELLELSQLLQRGDIKAVVDKVYPYQQIAEAHRRVELEQRLGSVVLSADAK